jgi:hypothetical protein
MRASSRASALELVMVALVKALNGASLRNCSRTASGPKASSSLPLALQ